MLYKEYNYHEVAYIYGFDEIENKTLWSRNILVDSKSVKRYFGYRDYFISAARYDNDMVNHMKANDGKVAGFNGKVWYDFIIIDVDERSPEKVSLFMQHLQINYGIQIDYCRLYFSGNKGFHILIPTPLFGFEPSKTLNLTIKKLVAKVSENILNYDLSLYDKLQVYRLPHTQHSSSDLFKIPLYYNELGKGYDYIAELAQKRRLKFDYPEYPTESDKNLIELAEESEEASKKTAMNDVSDTIYTDRELHNIPQFRKRCILHMLNGVGEGTRDEVAIRLAAHFKKERYPLEVVFGIMHGWNTLNNPPMTKEEIRAKVLSVFRSKFDYGCRDEVMLSYCDPNCYLFRR